jgi:hypothetical protein
MDIEKDEFPTPPSPAATRKVPVQDAIEHSAEDGPFVDASPSTKAQRSPRQSESRHLNRKSGGRIKPVPPAHTRDPEKPTSAGTAHQRHDSVLEQVYTYDSKEEKAIVKNHALRILVCPSPLSHNSANCRRYFYQGRCLCSAPSIASSPLLLYSSGPSSHCLASVIPNAHSA